MSVNPKLDSLRTQIRILEGHNLETPDDRRFLPFADERLNAPLPYGGLALGALHEFTAEGLDQELSAAATAFAVTVAARALKQRNGFLLWACARPDLYPPGLACFGLSPSRIVWVDCRKDTEVLGVMEEALHSRALAAVLGEAGSLSLKTARRLDAAARQSGSIALLVRRQIFSHTKAGNSPSGAAASRWRVSSVPSQHAVSVGPTGLRLEPEPGTGLPRWRLDLDYCRNGRTASWIVEASDGSEREGRKAGHVRVVSELLHDAGAAEDATARETKRTARAS